MESSYKLVENQRAILKISYPKPPRSRFLESIGKRSAQTPPADSIELELDLSQQIVRLYSPDDDDDWSNRNELEPTLPLDSSSQLVSLAVLAFKAKQFDDGLYAAIELAAQQGTGKFAGKIAIIKQLLQSLDNAHEQGTKARQSLLASAQLGGLDISIPADLTEIIAQLRREFLNDEKRSKPLSFYNWRTDLKAIFQQDRMLQTVIDEPASIATLTNALKVNNDLHRSYENYLTLITKLTNPLALASINDALQLQAQQQQLPKEIAIFPASRAHETELMKRLYGNRPIPAGFDLADEMIKQITNGSIDLTPREDSGWYDYQTWALEPLVIPDRMPEFAHLEFNKPYRDHLHKTFKGLLALTRETHVKQLEAVAVGGAWGGRSNKLIINITPRLNVEPLPSYYLRRALGYRFVLDLLDQIFGLDALTQLHRVKSDGQSELDLMTELYQMMLLCYSAYVTANAQLGLPPELPMQFPHLTTIDDYLEFFLHWQANLAEDDDLKQDNRMMVPVFYDLERKKTKVWLLLGWATQAVTISFARPPAVSIKSISGLDANNIEVKFDGISRQVVYPVTAEVYVDKILDRAEFQSHCDHYKSQHEILKNLR